MPMTRMIANGAFIILFMISIFPLGDAVADAELSGTYMESANTTFSSPGAKELMGVKSDPVVNPAGLPFGISSDVTFASAYIWHGLDYSERKPVLQPEVVFQWMKFSGSIWFNYDYQTYSAINEYDSTLQYMENWGPAGLTLGYTYLTYPHRGFSDSQEIWIQGSYDYFLNPSLAIHDDFQSGKGWYYNLGISHNFDWPIGTLTPSIYLYYHDHYYEGTGFPSVEFDLNDAITLGPVVSSVKASYFLPLKNGDFNHMGDSFLYSINLSWSFS